MQFKKGVLTFFVGPSPSKKKWPLRFCKSWKFNICYLPTSYLRNVDMPNIKQSIQAAIPERLQYACQFWADHVTTVNYDDKHAPATEKFFLEKFLFWLETLSLLGIVGSSNHTLSKLISWAPVVRRFTGSLESLN
jgi:hypothetical protein